MPFSSRYRFSPDYSLKIGQCPIIHTVCTSNRIAFQAGRVARRCRSYICGRVKFSGRTSHRKATSQIANREKRGISRQSAGAEKTLQSLYRVRICEIAGKSTEVSNYCANILNLNDLMAERQGFEPWLEFPLNTLSKRAPSATRPSLRSPQYSKSSIPPNLVSLQAPSLVRARRGFAIADETVYSTVGVRL